MPRRPAGSRRPKSRTTRPTVVEAAVFTATFQEGYMRKPELAAAIAERADLSKDKASQVLNVILDEITGSVAKGQDVSLIGFGSFTVRERAARTGKNPQTGESLTIPASKTVAFKAGKALKDAVSK
ncbi:MULTISPECIES: HU family DNA-binding protein [Modicisalibacter]|nr:HU family DNA-binding protein [Halomonas coralii]